MKKRNLAFIPVLAAFIFCGCGTQTIKHNPTDIGNGSNNGASGTAYSVSLYVDEQIYYPSSSVKANWSNGVSITSASFDDSGVASARGLNGEYRVTLSGLPEGYIYNPNLYIASGDNKDIKVELYKTGSITSGNGTGIYTPYVLADTGKYRATFTQSVTSIAYMFTPLKSGVYSIESWVDTTADEINPIVDIYGGTVGLRFYMETRDAGSADFGAYTKNFRYEIEVTDNPNTVGNSFVFVVRYDSRSTVSYPVKIDFAVTYEGNATDWGSDREIMKPEEDFAKRKEELSDPAADGMTWRYAYQDTANRLINANYKLNPEDGLYHLWDALTETYGPVLYAKITKDSTCMVTNTGTGFIDGLVRLNNLNDRDYSSFIKSGYALYCNSDGTYPVTEELKQFLHDYSSAQRLFMDGIGIAEDWYGLRAGELDQWLFACGYYIEN